MSSIEPELACVVKKIASSYVFFYSLQNQTNKQIVSNF